MLNGNSKQAAEEVEAEAAPSAPAMDAREAHKRFMQQLNSCTDEECVKQAPARRPAHGLARRREEKSHQCARIHTYSVHVYVYV